MNKLLEEEKADKIREQYEETLPLDTETLFLVLVVAVILLALSLGIYPCGVKLASAVIQSEVTVFW